MGLPSHQHQNPNTIPSHQHRIQVPSHPISTRLPLPPHPIYTRRRLPSHLINAFLHVSHPIPSHQCISSCFPSHRIIIIKESDSHPIFVMVKLKKNPACGGLSDGIPSHVVPSAPRIGLKKSSPWSQGRKTPFGRKERTTYSPYKEKAEMVQKILGKSDTSQKKKNTCVWLSGSLHIKGRLNEGPRLQRKHKDENEAK